MRYLGRQRELAHDASLLVFVDPGRIQTPHRGMWWLPMDTHTFLISAKTS